MKIQSQTSERGQAIVLLVLAMVVLLGFTALAVDGSLIYSDRRFAQSGADAASMAGGGAAAQAIDNLLLDKSTWSTNADCTSGNVAAAATSAREIAVTQAAANHFTIGNTTPVLTGFVTTECGVESISSSGTEAGDCQADDVVFSRPYMDVRTVITSTTQTAFAHFVFKGALVNSVTAVTRIHPREPFAYGYAIVALNPDLDCNTTDNGTNFHGLGGGNNITVYGGGVFSNGCFSMSGNPNATVNDAGVFFFGTDNHGTGFDVNSDEDPCRLTDTNTRIPPSSYDPHFDAGARCSQGGDHWVNGSAIVGTLAPGLYCVDGDVKLNSHDTLIGDGVTIYLSNGSLEINGGATVQLKAPASTYTGPAIPNIVIYIPPTNPVTNKDFQINGDSTSFYDGTILAPTKTIDFNGNGSITATNAQIIGWNVKIGGSSNTSVTYDEDETAIVPANLNLFR